MEIVLKNNNLRENVTDGDMDVYMSLGFVVRARFGSLVALRTELKDIFKDSFAYPTISSSPLYVVHWNDLTDDAQKQIGHGRT